MKDLNKAQAVYVQLLLHPYFEYEWTLDRLNPEGTVDLTKGSRKATVRLIKGNGPEHYAVDVDRTRHRAYTVAGLAEVLSDLDS